jgi:hypothetical protein
MNLNILWDVVPCFLVKVHKCFGGMYWFQLQGRRISHANNQQQAGSLLVLLSLPLWRWRQYIPLKCLNFYQRTWPHILEDSALQQIFFPVHFTVSQTSCHITQCPFYPTLTVATAATALICNSSRVCGRGSQYTKPSLMVLLGKCMLQSNQMVMEVRQWALLGHSKVMLR